MKTVTLTAVLTIILGIPLAIWKYRARLLPVRSGIAPITKEERLYDIDDFLS